MSTRKGSTKSNSVVRIASSGSSLKHAGRVSPSWSVVNHESLVRQVKSRSMSGSAAGEVDAKQDESALLYECRDYSTWSLSMLDAMRVERTLCDVIISVGQSGNIYAHQSILACNSSFLMNVFQRATEVATGSLGDVSFSRNGQRHLYVHLAENFDEDACNQLIEYMYCGRIWISERNAASLYMTASRLCVPPVVKACAKYLQAKMAPSNVLEILAPPFPLDINLKEMAVLTVQRNYHDVMESKGFEQLPRFVIEIRGRPVVIDDYSRFARCVIAYLVTYYGRQREHSLSLLANSTHRIYVDGRDENGNPKWPSDEEVEAPTISGRHFIDHDIQMDKLMLPKADTVSEHPVNEEKSSITFEMIHTERSVDLTLTGLASIDYNLISFTILVKSRDSCLNHSRKCSADHPLAESSQNGRRNELCLARQGQLGSPTENVLMSQPRAGLMLISHQDVLLFVGGYNSGACLDSVEALDIETGKFTKWPPLKGRRGRCFATEFDGSYALFGGSSGNQLLTDCVVIDLESRTWSALADFRIPLANSTIVANDLSGDEQVLFALCGSNDKEPSHTCAKYSRKSKSWQAIANCLQERIYPMAIWHEGNLFVFGGHSTWRCLRKCEMYTPSTNSWKELPDLPESRRSAGIASFNGKLYLIGGTDGLVTMRAVDIFNPMLMQWEKGPDLKCCRSFPGVTVRDNRLYVAGGFDGNTFQRTIEVYDGTEWSYLKRTESMEKSDNFTNEQNGNPSMLFSCQCSEDKGFP